MLIGKRLPRSAAPSHGHLERFVISATSLKLAGELVWALRSLGVLMGTENRRGGKTVRSIPYGIQEHAHLEGRIAQGGGIVDAKRDFCLAWFRRGSPNAS